MKSYSHVGKSRYKWFYHLNSIGCQNCNPKQPNSIQIYPTKATQLLIIQIMPHFISPLSFSKNVTILQDKSFISFAIKFMAGHLNRS